MAIEVGIAQLNAGLGFLVETVRRKFHADVRRDVFGIIVSTSGKSQTEKKPWH